MKRLIGVCTLIVCVCGLMLAGPASAETGVKRAAKAECRDERRSEPAEFANRYGGSGDAALRRCARRERREARADCAQDRREEPGEFSREYGGTGHHAMKRCMRDEIR